MFGLVSETYCNLAPYHLFWCEKANQSASSVSKPRWKAWFLKQHFDNHENLNFITIITITTRWCHFTAVLQVLCIYQRRVSVLLNCKIYCHDNYVIRDKFDVKNMQDALIFLIATSWFSWYDIWVLQIRKPMKNKLSQQTYVFGKIWCIKFFKIQPSMIFEISKPKNSEKQFKSTNLSFWLKIRFLNFFQKIAKYDFWVIQVQKHLKSKLRHQT